MNAFVVTAPNKPGELARLTDSLAHRGIDITGFSSATCGDTGTAYLLTNDEVGTRSALMEGRWNFTEQEVVSAQLSASPGSLHEASERLGKAGVNIDGAIATGMSGNTVSIAFITNNPSKAREALGQQVLVGHSSGSSHH
jgi:hypothetical protein